MSHVREWEGGKHGKQEATGFSVLVAVEGLDNVIVL
jgi:hypothetical protein